MYKVLRKNFVYRWRRPKELPLIYKKRRSNPMIGTPLFLNNSNYTHTIENVNKINKQFGSFSLTYKKKRSFHSFSQIEDKVLIKVSSKDFNFNLKRGYPRFFYLSNNSLFSIKSSSGDLSLATIKPGSYWL